MNRSNDAYGSFYRKSIEKGAVTEYVERDDGLKMVSRLNEIYLSSFENWSPVEQELINHARNPVIDLACGAGRVGLYLQDKEYEVLSVDASQGAVETAKKRGIQNVKMVSLENLQVLRSHRLFETATLFGNDFGLVRNPKAAKRILNNIDSITTNTGRLLVVACNPYLTNDPVHLEYHDRNRRIGKLPGQLTIRLLVEDEVGDWFEYLFVSPEEMENILKGTRWKISEIITHKSTPSFGAILDKI